MKKFSNFRRKSKIAIALLSVFLGGNISSAKDICYIPNQASGVSMDKTSKPDTKSAQTAGKIEETSITSNKSFKPLVITVGTLAACSLFGFIIYGLARNKEKIDTPTKDDDIKNNMQSKIQDREINEYQITREKEIEEHNKNLICNAIALAKKENKLHCDEDSLKNAMFELFDRLARIKYEDKAWGVVCPLWKFFHEKKIPNISIGEYESENYVFLHTGEEHDYSIVWLPGNKVSIGFHDKILNCCFESVFENLKSPFEVKN